MPPAPHHAAGPDDRSVRALFLQRRGQTIGTPHCCVSQISPLYAGLATPGVAALEIERCVADICAPARQVIGGSSSLLGVRNCASCLARARSGRAAC